MDALGSIIFLAIFALVPLAIVASLVLLLVKRGAINAVWRRAAPDGSMRFLEPGSVERAEVERRLTARALSGHGDSWEHRITHARGGSIGGATAFVAFVASVGRGLAGKRPSTRRFVTAVEHPGLPHALVIHRPAAGRLGAFLSGAMGGLSAPSDPAWSWMRVSSPGEFAALGLAPDRSQELESLLEPGDTLLLNVDHVAHIRPGENSIHARAVGSYLDGTSDRITRMRAILAR